MLNVASTASPFDEGRIMEPESLPPFAPDTDHATAPVSDQPPQPRLGILHLLVLTACVAAYLGVSRT